MNEDKTPFFLTKWEELWTSHSDIVKIKCSHPGPPIKLCGAQLLDTLQHCRRWNSVSWWSWGRAAELFHPLKAAVNLRTLNKHAHVCLKVSLQQIRWIFEKKKRNMKCGGDGKKPQGVVEKCLNGGEKTSERELKNKQDKTISCIHRLWHDELVLSAITFTVYTIIHHYILSFMFL